jgi:hypothetical protein
MFMTFKCTYVSKVPMRANSSGGNSAQHTQVQEGLEHVVDGHWRI